MAAPLVAGQVAVLRSSSPDLDGKKMIERIGHSSVKIKGKLKVGKGRIDIVASLDE